MQKNTLQIDAHMDINIYGLETRVAIPISICKEDRFL